MNNKKQALGIYIHIPFCEKKCDYCDFLSGPANNEVKKNYIKALLNEIKSYKGLVEEYLVKTIFIGGGTPSSIDPNYIDEILDSINRNLLVEADEITIELNPGTLSKDKLDTYKDAGINRLSIGLQSTNNKELKLLGRIHTYEEFIENYNMARELGFTNISIDLMSGLPGQKLEDWEDTLQKVVDLEPEHISAYSLIIEEGTPFYDRYKRDEKDGTDEDNIEENNIDEDIDRLIYSKTKEILISNGYKRYEISNYAKEGYESKHNLSYWEGTQYLGIGLGASSLIKNIRFNNEEDINKYIENSANHEKLNKDIVKLSKNERMEEFAFLGLRKTKGISKDKFKDEFAISIEEVFGQVIKKSINEGVITDKDERIYLTDYGLDVSNYVLARFLLD